MKTNPLIICLLLMLFAFKTEAQYSNRLGWWKFDDPIDLTKAEIGDPLVFSSFFESVNGPAPGNKAVSVGVGNYISMTHKMYPNGGGTLVNDYTLQIDFKVPEINIWHAFFQTDPTNSDDADLFTSSGSNSIGTATTTYSSKSIVADTWYRMVLTVSNGYIFKIYMDGTLWLDGAGQPIDGRFALSDVLLLFADNDGEDSEIICSELGIWDYALEDYEVIALGDASGVRIRERSKLGSWKFDNPSDLLIAEVGLDLVLTGTQESVPGPVEGDLATKIGAGSYLSIDHGIVPNDGQSLVNEYSIQIDFSVPETNIWHAFYQTDPTNSSDAELFTKNTNNTIGTSETGYSTNDITANTWYRMVITVKNGEFYKVYLNGALWLNASGLDIDGRFGLESVLLFFADDNGEDNFITCSELSIWEVALTANEVADLGSSPLVNIPQRSGWWSFDDTADLLKANIGAPLELTGAQLSKNGPVEGNNATSIDGGSYLTMNHGISGNGSGLLVNEYSLLIDFSVTSLNIWRAFIQTDTENLSDADLFINGGTSTPNTIGTAATSYSFNTVTPFEWYRMVLSVKNGGFFRIYINGEIWLDAAGQAVDGRWALLDKLLLFADNDGDDGSIICSEVAIWDFPLTSDQIAKLGTPTTGDVVGISEFKPAKNDSFFENIYPNPFSNSTNISYSVKTTGPVTFRILDISGKEVSQIREGIKSPGSYSTELNSKNLDEGVYFLQMNSGQGSETKKIIIVK
ncbi:MAG: T9SS type A sorting domain-containing protein [Bacteroidales bacterium]|nr:T9SS type A sorting domain-containing protein [Bacteroidales bacterium]MCF8404082.1 T9SS type A sorting domain-containing protein [Bacteroidales bacterium]